MDKNYSRTIAYFLIVLLLSGCSLIAPKETHQERTEAPSSAPTTIPTVQPVPSQVVEEDIVPTDEIISPTPYEEATPEPSDTPSPVDTPEPTAMPEPTATPEPNPYVGVWTIEELPISIELRSDCTYLITVSEEEREGTYTIDTNGVLLSVNGEQTVELHYYSKADVFKVDDFKLIRDDLVFFFEINAVPVSFKSENEDLRVGVRGAVVEAETKNERTIRSYCFTEEGLTPPEDSRDWFDTNDFGKNARKIRVFKYDGNYTLWMRDAEGAPFSPIDVVVESGFAYPIESEQEVVYLHQSLRQLLRGRGSGVDELNRTISRDITAAGIYTRAGTVTAGVSLISELSKYGYSIGYQQNGTFQEMEDWGVNPGWGAKLAIASEETEEIEPVESYAGMNGNACIVWTFKQAGLNVLCNDAKAEIGMLGEHEKANDNRISADRAKSGDLIKRDGRYVMVIDRLDTDHDGMDDAYLTFEMGSQFLTMRILPFDRIQNRDVYSMDAVFDGTGKNAHRAKYWKDKFRIPEDQLPMYQKEIMESETTMQSFMDLIEKLGF